MAKPQTLKPQAAAPNPPASGLKTHDPDYKKNLHKQQAAERRERTLTKAEHAAVRQQLLNGASAVKELSSVTERLDGVSASVLIGMSKQIAKLETALDFVFDTMGFEGDPAPVADPGPAVTIAPPNVSDPAPTGAEA